MKIFPVHKFRSEGDAARDKKLWPEAAVAYKNHLLDHPDDAEIWVQLGHALKEHRKLDEAEDAYRNAVTLRPEDADSSLHLAHLLKRSGRVSEAAQMFAASFKSSPSGDAYNELKHLRGTVPIEFSEDNMSTEMVLIEIDDLFGYLEAHKTLSGIQRVQVEVIQHVLATRGHDKTSIFVINTNDPDSLNASDAGCMWHLRDENLLELVSYLSSAHIDHDYLKRIIANARNGASLITPQAGQSYLILGAFWGSGESTRRHLFLKRSGILLGACIYDLIPISYPEYCDAKLSHDFALCFADAMAIFDFVLTISKYTASEVIRYRKKFNLAPIPVIAVPLAHTQSSNAPLQRMGWSAKIARFKNRPFVLMVSTIEARKNHAYLVAAWKQFIDEGLDPPDLVFVGRIGWRVSSLMEMLEQSRYLNGRVHILHDLSDAELQALYKASLFTAFPSFVEGWGLPVGESLAHGRPCVASSTSSIPEVGGDLVDYLDPHNLRAGLEVLRKMTFNAPYRAKRERAIAEQFVLRGWREVGADILNEIGKLKSRIEPKPEFQVLFPAGSVFNLSDLSIENSRLQDYARCPKRLMLAPFCYPIENHGCWIQGSQGTLTFRSDLAAETEIVVYISLLGVPWAGPGHMIRLDTQNPNVTPAATINDVKKCIPENGKFVMRCIGNVDKNGDVTVNFRVEGEIPPQQNANDARRFVLGIVAFGYASRNNPVSRADISEALLFDLD